MKLPHRDHGFTLIELLVVIAIIAILATIGLVIYANVQKNARDSRRRSDVEAISRALEGHYNSNGTYNPLVGNWFSSNNGNVPVDPGTYAYCMWSSTTAQTIGAPSSWTGGTCPSANIGGTGTSGTVVAVGIPPANTTNWEICASLENGGVYCLLNQQQ